jgi:hypothetical protein
MEKIMRAVLFLTVLVFAVSNAYRAAAETIRIDFERAGPGSVATELYADQGLRFPSAPIISRIGLWPGQVLQQGEVSGGPDPLPTRVRCAPLEIDIDRNLQVRTVELTVLNRHLRFYCIDAFGEGRTIDSFTFWPRGEGVPGGPPLELDKRVVLRASPDEPDITWVVANPPADWFDLMVIDDLSITGNTRALVEATGQTQCWRPDDVPPIDAPPVSGRPMEIRPCPPRDAAVPDGEGQDGRVRAGVPHPNPRFTVNRDRDGNEDGTVTDKLTGLIWLQNANCFDRRTWQGALEAANNLQDLPDDTRDCGLRDGSHKGAWRLPNVKELQSLIVFGFSNPALSDRAGTSQCNDTNCAFSGVGTGRFYWSSTTFLEVPIPGDSPVNKAWGVDVGNGNTPPHFRWHANPRTTTTFFVWPVKGPSPGVGRARVEVTGQKTCWAPNEMSNEPVNIPCTVPSAEGQDGELARRIGVRYPEPRFTSNRDGTVTDNLTGLTWLQHANCFGTKTWAEALEVANGLHHGSGCDLRDESRPGMWRLPNVKELQSLIDFGTGSHSPVVLPDGHPFHDVKLRLYWSSTTFAGEWDDLSPGEPDDAWAVSLRVGITELVGTAAASCLVIKNELRGVWPVKGGILGTPEP